MSKRKKALARAMRRREIACQCAAEIMASRPDQDMVPALWSLSVFFDAYMARGAEGAKRDFGPKKPAKLRIAR